VLTALLIYEPSIVPTSLLQAAHMRDCRGTVIGPPRPASVALIVSGFSQPDEADVDYLGALVASDGLGSSRVCADIESNSLRRTRTAAAERTTRGLP